jgi:photosystem II stability/assembly factor-like uncharacterized protein
LVLRTDDGGLSWRRLTHGGRDDLANIFFIDNSHGWAVGSMVGSFSQTLAEDVDSSAFNSAENLNAITFVNEKSGWVVGDKGTILHSVTSGVTWNAVTHRRLKASSVYRLSVRQRVGSSGARCHLVY